MSESARRHPPGPDEVHVWWIDLHAPAAAAVLSPAERARAARFHHGRDRTRWARARAAIRCILGDYLGISPKDVQFITPEPPHISPSPSAAGERERGVRAAAAKPALRNDPRLRFNLAHAGGRAALALAWEREVGIDLEPVDPALDLFPLLPVTCTPAEMARIDALPPPERAPAFLTLWTIKEAYLKAIGVGLFRDPRSLETERLPHGRARVHDARAGAAGLGWEMHILDAGPGWAAALAADGADFTIQAFAWPDASDAPS